MMSHENTSKILITGAGGQLGSDFQLIQFIYPEFEFVYCSRKDLDITDESEVYAVLGREKPLAVINCAAYTNVEKAEDEPEVAILQNATGVKHLAEACEKWGALLVHFSTDYVFDGKKSTPYTEEDPTSPLNAYGQSKLLGEIEATKCSRHFVIRVSWLYSTFGNNFYKTMLRLARERGALRVVADQVASPTYARHLAHDVMSLLEKRILLKEEIPFGLYHYAQNGVASWFEFAREIMLEAHINVPVDPVSSVQFPTKATRPTYSKMSNSKWTELTKISPVSWREGLIDCIHNDIIQNQEND